MKQLAICCLIFPVLALGVTKERNWKAGKVTADSTINSPEYTSGAAEPHYASIDPNILTIQGSDYIYTAQEKHPWTGWCLLIQSEDIRYSQDNRRLYIIDADGDKCRLDILKQEKRPSP